MLNTPNTGEKSSRKISRRTMIQGGIIGALVVLPFAMMTARRLNDGSYCYIFSGNELELKDGEYAKLVDGSVWRGSHQGRVYVPDQTYINYNDRSSCYSISTTLTVSNDAPVELKAMFSIGIFSERKKILEESGVWGIPQNEKKNPNDPRDPFSSLYTRPSLPYVHARVKFERAKLELSKIDKLVITIKELVSS
jgi:hypothetical protein